MLLFDVNIIISLFYVHLLGFGVCSDQLDNFHAEKLEYIIIYLIVIEVVVAVGWNILLKDIFGFFQHGGAE